MTTAFPQRSFASGELTPSLYARVDLARYITGLRTCRNHYIMKHGGAINRSGFKYIGEVKDSTKTVRLIPFIFNSDQTYILEFGENYIRFYKDGVQLESGGVPYEVTTTYTESELMELRYVQSADVITIVHPSHAPAELARLADTNWTLTDITFGPSISAVTSLTATPDTVISTHSTTWAVYAVSIGGEYSLVATASANVQVSSTNTVQLAWTASDGANHYKIFRGGVPSTVFSPYTSSGETGYIGQTDATTFVDSGQDVDYEEIKPDQNQPFQSADNYPSAVSLSQQRLFMGGTNNDPETVWGTRTGGNRKDFSKYFPSSDADAIEFTLTGNQVNRVLHLSEIGQLFVLTSGGEIAINGNSARVVTPTSINSKLQSTHGASDIRPLVVNDLAFYVQSRGSIIRDFQFNYEISGYAGNDLTVFSSHLFKGYEISDWAYQENPDSVVWVVRSDGTLLSLTYLREHSMLAWARHDTEVGEVERVQVVPEGGEDVLYLVVKRTIDGSDVRYIERMAKRDFSDIEDAVFLDSYLSYDGTNTDDSHTMILSGSSTWGHTEDVTITSSVAFFSASDVGNAIHFTDSDGDVVRCVIKTYTNTTTVVARPHMTIPADLRSTATASWGKAVDELSGLDHLEGEDVGVFADGFVVSSPNNPAYSTLTVSSGAITLPRPHVVIHAGLPITADIETLDIDTVQGPTTISKKQLPSEINLFIESSRGIFAGQSAPTGTNAVENLDELQIRNNESMDSPPDLTTDWVKIRIKSNWSRSGRVFIRQVDPVPLKVLAVAPGGYLPTGSI